MKQRMCSLLLIIAVLLTVLPTVGAEDGGSFLYSMRSDGSQEAYVMIEGYSGTLPGKLTVYGYADTSAAEYCLSAGIRFADIETGESAAKIYETELEGIRYRVDPARGYASIIGCDPERLDSILVLPETADGYPVTRVESWGLSEIECRGIVFPDTITYFADLAITPADINYPPVFLSMPDNEVYIHKNFISIDPNYFYLPKNFSLAENCRENASEICGTQCIGFEKHKSLLPEEYLITIDEHADSRHLLTTGGVFRVDGEELTAIYLIGIAESNHVFRMASSVGGMPITRIASSCKSYNAVTILGSYVRVVEDGALAESGEQYINALYLPPCIEYLPPDLLHRPDITTIYGTTGTYAETYAKEHGSKFMDMQKTPFRDVPESAWFFPYVRDAYWYHIMRGTSETTFEPEAATTRAMVVQVLYNLVESTETGAWVIFTDVRKGDWYFDAVSWAWMHGVCNGTSDTTFSPNDPVTREQLAAFLYRFAKLCGYECKGNGDLSAYKDSDRISPYALDAITWAVSAGIINGTSATTLEPQSRATRAELATMICRLLAFMDQDAPTAE